MINGGSLIAEQFYLSEINLTTVATNQRYPFTDIPTLRYGTINVQCIKTWDADQISKSPGGNTVIASTELPGLTLTLCIADQEESIFQLPLYDLCSPLNGGLERLFNNCKVDLTRSYLTVTNSSIVTATHSVLIGWYFKETGRGPQAPITHS